MPEIILFHWPLGEICLFEEDGIFGFYGTVVSGVSGFDDFINNFLAHYNSTKATVLIIQEC